MQDQPVVGVEAVFGRDEIKDIVFDAVGRFCFTEADAV